jgi:hypothetical protein
MSPLVRNILAVVGGVAAAFAVVMIVESACNAVYPPPTGIDFSKPEVVREYMAVLPFGAFMFVLTALAGGALAGSMVAARVSRTRRQLCAGIVGAVVLAATLMNLILIPHPLWFASLCVVGVIAATLVSGKVAGFWTREKAVEKK